MTLYLPGPMIGNGWRSNSQDIFRTSGVTAKRLALPRGAKLNELAFQLSTGRRPADSLNLHPVAWKAGNGF